MSLIGRAIAPLAASLALSGCMTAVRIYDRPSENLLREMEAACERDAGVRWMGAVPVNLDLWLPGSLDREPSAGELAGVRPYDRFWPNFEDFLSRGLARSLLVNIRPRGETGPNMPAGPLLGEPAGIYRIVLAPSSDDRCARRRSQIAASSPAGSPAEAYARDTTRPCAVHTYVGPFDGSPKLHMFLRFTDVELQQKGLFRDGERLFIDGRLRAGYTDYWAVDPRGSAERRSQWGIKACKPAMNGSAAVAILNGTPAGV